MSSTDVNTVLVADNNTDYRRSLISYLTIEGFQIEEAASFQTAIEKILSLQLDLALIDLRLTDESAFDLSGLEVAKVALRRGVPCIIISAYDSQDATRQALRARGIDPPLAVDFVLKGHGPHAILDAVRVTLSARKSHQRNQLNHVIVDTHRQLVWRGTKEIKLSPHQYALVSLLYEARGKVCSYEHIIKEVYDDQLITDRGNVDKRIERMLARVRKKLEVDPNEPRILVSVAGRGLRWGGDF